MKENIQEFALLHASVRTAVVDGKPYFNLNDVLSAFEVKKPDYERSVLVARIAQTNAAIDDLNAKGSQKNGTPLLGAADGLKKIVTETNGGPQEMFYCNEPALYYLASRGKSNACLVFSHWVYAVVLPKLRESGYFVSSSISADQMEQLLEEIADLRARAITAEQEAEGMKVQLDEATSHMTLVKYLALHPEIALEERFFSSYGRKIKRFCTDLGRADEIQVVVNQKYPANAYPTDLLDAFFAATKSEEEGAC